MNANSILLSDCGYVRYFNEPKYQRLHMERLASLRDARNAVAAQLEQACRDEPFGVEAKQLQEKLWHLARRAGISGSNAAVTMGISPYKSKLQLFNELSGRVEPEPVNNNFVEWGHRLEGAVAAKYADFHGVHVLEMDTFESPIFPFMTASVDRFITDDQGNATAVLEIKTAGFNRKVVLDGEEERLWGRGCSYIPVIDQHGKISQQCTEIDSACPPWYIAQVLHYMVASGVHEGRLAVLIGGNDYRDYVVPFSEETAGALIMAEDEFYCKHVLDDIEPPLNAKELRSITPVAKSKVEATAEIEEAVASIKELDLQEKAINSRKEELKARVMEYMGDKEALTYGNSTLATFGEQKGRTTVDSKALKEQEPELFKKFSKTGASFRVFKLK